MIAWEYMTFKSNSLDNAVTGENDFVRLQELGRQGWELISIERSSPFTVSAFFVSYSKVHSERTYYLKRPLGNEKAWG